MIASLALSCSHNLPGNMAQIIKQPLASYFAAHTIKSLLIGEYPITNAVSSAYLRGSIKVRYCIIFK